MASTDFVNITKILINRELDNFIIGSDTNKLVILYQLNFKFRRRILELVRSGQLSLPQVIPLSRNRQDRQNVATTIASGPGLSGLNSMRSMQPTRSMTGTGLSGLSPIQPTRSIGVIQPTRSTGTTGLAGLNSMRSMQPTRSIGGIQPTQSMVGLGLSGLSSINRMQPTRSIGTGLSGLSSMGRMQPTRSIGGMQPVRMPPSTTTPIIPKPTAKYLTIADVKPRYIGMPQQYVPEVEYTQGMFVNWSNSCFLDSLLFAMYIGSSPYFRKLMLSSDIDAQSYTNPETGRAVTICDSNSSIQTVGQIVNYVEQLQDQLRLEYNALFSQQEQRYCVDLRQMLQRCITDLTENGQWVQYNVHNLYSYLISLYPAIINMPIVTIDGSKFKRVSVNFSFREFMEPAIPPEGEANFSFYEWDKLASGEVQRPESLAFFNQVLPQIHQLDSFKADVQTLYMGNQPVYVTHEKARIFGEYILDASYRLFAVIINTGPRPQYPGDEGGGHYTAYIRSSTVPDQWTDIENEHYTYDQDDSTWYFYNDIGPIFEPLPGLPDNVFTDSSLSRPEILLYELINP